MSADIVQEIVIDAPPAEVWRHLADRDALSRWLMPTPDFEPRVGAAFTFRTTPIEGWDGIVRCTVREVEPGAATRRAGAADLPRPRRLHGPVRAGCGAAHRRRRRRVVVDPLGLEGAPGPLRPLRLVGGLVLARFVRVA